MIIKVKSDLSCGDSRLIEVSLNDVLFCGTRRITYRGESFVVPEEVALEIDQMIQSIDNTAFTIRTISMTRNGIVSAMGAGGIDQRAVIDSIIGAESRTKVYDYICSIAKKNIQIAN